MSFVVLAQDSFIQDRTGRSNCVADDGFCPQWIVDNLDRYVSPFWEHLYLTAVSVALGFAIAVALGLLAHRRRWLAGPITWTTSAIYTIPSPSMFLLLLPITGRGTTTAIVALTAYTQVIIFRNVVNGLASVPADAVDAATGMGMTPTQRLFRVEVPLALPEILAGLRIAAASTVGLASLAFLAGAGGLGKVIEDQITFKSNVVVAGTLVTLMAAALDLVVLGVQRAVTPWQRAASS
jgi:osmoprotectant transport system permease protein